MDKGTSINSISVIASEAKQSRNLDKSTPILDRHVAARLATTIFGGIHKSYGYAFGVLLLASQGAWASVPDVSGMSCMNGELTVVTGAAFSARCAGDLRFEASGIIEAEESITLRATGTIWMLGTLVAPRIELVAEASAHVSGGLFSGSPDFYPDVNAVSYAGSLTAFSRDFNDLVPRPHIDPVFGAATFTMVVPIPVVEITPAVMHEFIVILDETTSPVPEPEQFALFAAGLGLIAWKRRSNRSMSHMAHAD